VPAARSNVVTEANIERLDTKIVVQGAGATIPVSESAERILHNRGVISILDFTANPGGLNCGRVER
jgi:glutamate dehydrogenase/leucine dehydrogenase